MMFYIYTEKKVSLFRSKDITGLKNIKKTRNFDTILRYLTTAISNERARREIHLLEVTK